MPRDDSSSSTGPAIHTLTWAQLQAYDVGRIKPGREYARQFPDQRAASTARAFPRLADLFDLVKRSGDDKVRFDIETKVNPEQAGRDARRPSRSRARWWTRSARRAWQRARRSSPSTGARCRWCRRSRRRSTRSISRCSGASTTSAPARPEGSRWTAGFQYRDHGSVPKMVKAAGGGHWAAYFDDLDAQKVKEAQALGLKVLAWTVNDPAVMARMLDLRRGRADHRPPGPRAQAARRARHPLALALPMRFSARQLHKGMKWWPPFLGAGIRVRSLSDDFRDAVVELKLGRLNRNYVGTHFGGSLYAMTDPFFAIMLMHNLGGDYLVWDKSGIHRVRGARARHGARAFRADRAAGRRDSRPGGGRRKGAAGIPGRGAACGERRARRAGAQDPLRAPEAEAPAGGEEDELALSAGSSRTGAAARSRRRTRWARSGSAPRWASRAWSSTSCWPATARRWSSTTRRWTARPTGAAKCRR